MTLVETVIGIAVLGTLLVAVLIASSRLTAQGARADQSAQAVAMADELMESFWKDLDKLPRSGSGDVPGHQGWRWRTSVRTSDGSSDGQSEKLLKESSAQVVLLEVYSDQSPDKRPAASVEFLAPMRQPTTAGAGP